MKKCISAVPERRHRVVPLDARSASVNMRLRAARVLLAACCLGSWAKLQAQAPPEAEPRDSPREARKARVQPATESRAPASRNESAQTSPEAKTQAPSKAEEQTRAPPAGEKAAAGGEEPHLFELLDAPPPVRGRRGRGRARARGAGARRIDYYYYYPRDMSQARTKEQSVQLLQQVMYKTQTRLADLARVIEPFVHNMAYRMAILDGRLQALKSDLRVIWSMAANNEMTISYSMERLVYLYAHELRKYFDLTYVVEFLLLLHHQNVKYVYRMKADVDRINEIATNNSQQQRNLF